MARHKNANWNLPEGERDGLGSRIHSWESIHAALLMDIRDELQEVNRHLRCHRVPRALDAMYRLEKRMAKRFPLKPEPKA